MIAVPDFAAGAMENWGLIIYRETALLYDPVVSSASNQQRVAVVVSHELAHQVKHVMGSPSSNVSTAIMLSLLNSIHVWVVTLCLSL